MPPLIIRTPLWKQMLALTVLIATVGVVANYSDYLPPNFRSDFLLGRKAYFFGVYQWAFYAHLVAGPVTLVLGLLLVSESFRRWWPAGHRRLGQLQVAIVLLLLFPSGLVMSWWAMTGRLAGVGLAMLALLTATFVALGWRTAVRQQFDAHRRWMLRTFALLCSAVVLRLIGGATELSGVEVNYALSVWMSWLVPLTTVEWAIRRPPVRVQPG